MHQRISLSELARRCLQRGFTTASLARAIGVSQPSVSRLASGKHKSIGGDAALRLIEAAGGSINLPLIAGDEPAGGVLPGALTAVQEVSHG